MSRTTAAVKLLLVSLPLVRSLPQLSPPYPIVISTTTDISEAVLATPTEEPDLSPVETDILVDLIPTDVQPDEEEAAPSVTVPLDPIYDDQIYVDPITSDWPYHTISPAPIADGDSVSLETFVEILQPLLDIIEDMLPEDEVLVHRYAEDLLPGLLPTVRPMILDAMETPLPEFPNIDSLESSVFEPITEATGDLIFAGTISDTPESPIAEPRIESIISETPEIAVPLPELSGLPLPDLTFSNSLSDLLSEIPAPEPVFPDAPSQPYFPDPSSIDAAIPGPVFPESSLVNAVIPGPVFPDASAAEAAIPGPVFPDTPSPKLLSPEPEDMPARASSPLKKREDKGWFGGIGESIINAITRGAGANKPTEATIKDEQPSLGAFRHDVLQLPVDLLPVGIAAVINGTIPSRNESEPYSEAAALALIEELLSLILQVLGLDFLPNDNGVNQTREEIELALREHNGPVATSDLFDIVNKVVGQELSHAHSNKGSHRGHTKRDASPATDAIEKFYASLQSSSDHSVDSIASFSDTLRASLKQLDASSQAALLEALKHETTQHELVKRQRPGRGRGRRGGRRGRRGRIVTDPRLPGFDGRAFIAYYTSEFHYYFPVLNELDPILAQGLSDILTDPRIPVPPYNSLRMDNLPDQLRRFVLDTYVFLQIIQEPTISTADKLLILEALFEGVELPGGAPGPGTPDPEPPINSTMIASEPTSAAPLAILPAMTPDAPTTTEMPTEMSTEIPGPFTTDAISPNTEAAFAPTTTIVPNVGPPAAGTVDILGTLDTLPAIGDFGTTKRRSTKQFMRRDLITKRRTMRHGLRTRQQYDEGVDLDDASKLGSALHAIAGPAGSLDPMGQYNAITQASYATAKSGHRNSRAGHRSSDDYDDYDYDDEGYYGSAYSPYEPDYHSPDYEPSDSRYDQYDPYDAGQYNAPAYVEDAVADLYGEGYDEKPDVNYWSEFKKRTGSIVAEGEA